MNRFKFDKFRLKREIGRHWIGNKVVDDWNALPNYRDSANSLDSFKNRVDEHNYECNRMTINI